MVPISALARRFGLARSTLLHYDRIGLLRPADRSRAGHRSHGEAEWVRLERIRPARHQRFLEALGRSAAVFAKVREATGPGG